MKIALITRCNLQNPVEVTRLSEGPQNMHYRLHLRFCSDYVSRLSCCPFRYSLPCRNLIHPHQKHTSLTMSLSAPVVRLDSTGLSDALMVEVGRIALPSRTPFTSLHTAIKEFMYLCNCET